MFGVIYMRAKHAVIVPGGKASNMTQMAAAYLAILGGTMQFYRSGIQPLERDRLEQEWNTLAGK